MLFVCSWLLPIATELLKVICLQFVKVLLVKIIFPVIVPPANGQYEPVSLIVKLFDTSDINMPAPCVILFVIKAGLVEVELVKETPPATEVREIPLAGLVFDIVKLFERSTTDILLP